MEYRGAAKWIQQETENGTIGTLSHDPNDLVPSRSFSEDDLMIAMQHATAAEREACAVLCDEFAAGYNETARIDDRPVTRSRWDTIERTALILAEEIRRRGKEAANEHSYP